MVLLAEVAFKLVDAPRQSEEGVAVAGEGTGGIWLI